MELSAPRPWTQAFPGATPGPSATGPTSWGSGGTVQLYTLFTLLLYTLYRYCSPNCTGRVRSEDPLYNLASPLYSRRWEERVYSLQGVGHCHTFNPENVSLSGLNGQHIVHLGQRLSEQ